MVRVTAERCCVERLCVVLAVGGVLACCGRRGSRPGHECVEAETSEAFVWPLRADVENFEAIISTEARLFRSRGLQRLYESLQRRYRFGGSNIDGFAVPCHLEM